MVSAGMGALRLLTLIAKPLSSSHRNSQFNCEMAHRQESYSLIVLSGWSPSVGLARRTLRSRKRLRHEVELTACCGPSVFVLGESSCAVSIARPL